MSTKTQTRRTIKRSPAYHKVSLSLRKVTLERLDKVIEHDGLSRSSMIDYLLGKLFDERDQKMLEQAVTRNTKA